jgi:hypothetical protein
MAIHFPTATLSALLVVLVAPSGASAQDPIAIPAESKRATAPASPAKMAAAASSGEATQGSMQILDLLASLARFDRNGRDPAQKLGFEIPERAVNEYLAYVLRTRPRPGISAITISLLPNNDVSGVVEIDFNTVKQWDPELLPEALRPLFSGRQTIKVNAHIESRNSTFTVVFKDVQGPDGKPLSNKLITDLLQTIGSRQPESYDTAKPMPLPFGLKRVWTGKQSVCGET